jgi:hypothetical protein
MGFVTPYGDSTGAPLVNGGTTVDIVGGKSGLALQPSNVNFNATKNVVTKVRVPRAGSAGGGITLYARVKPITIGEVVATYSSARFHAHLQFATNIGIGFGSNTSGQFTAMLAMGVLRTVSLSGIVFGSWYDVFVEVPNNTTSSFARIYVPGVGAASSTTGNMNSTITDANLYIGHAVSTGSPGNRQIECAAAWDRLLPDDEKERFARNPYQILRAPRMLFAVAASSYTHPTLSASTATEIGPTSFKPRVTYAFP